MMVNVNKAGIDNEEGVQTVWEEDKWWLWLSAAAIWKFYSATATKSKIFAPFF